MWSRKRRRCEGVGGCSSFLTHALAVDCLDHVKDSVERGVHARHRLDGEQVAQERVDVDRLERLDLVVDLDVRSVRYEHRLHRRLVGIVAVHAVFKRNTV